jgi:hypothetical protein
MNRNELPKVVQDKISGYTWIKLGQLNTKEKFRLTIQTKNNNSDCIHEIESNGYQLFPILENRYAVMRSRNGAAGTCSINDLMELAMIECVLSIDISPPVSMTETKNANQ